MLGWHFLDTWLVTFISIAYLSILFVIAYVGRDNQVWAKKPWVYGLTLGVSFTSWAFYGTVGQAALTGQWLAPLYIGTLLCFVVLWPMLLKTLRIIKEQNLTSIADFIACRYDRSPKMAMLVAIVSLFGTIPYIALQLRAISTSFDLLTGTFQVGASTTLVVTCVLIVFSILFGTRQVSMSQQNSGLILAIAFSSVIKLLALSAIGIFATFVIFDGFGDLLIKQAQADIQYQGNSAYFVIAQVLLGAITIFILPQQFHMMMIENHNETGLKNARWLFPIYLIAINIFVLPIAIAGQLNFLGGSVNPDTFVLSLPLMYQQPWLGMVAYIGGLAAATSMVVVAAIVLSTMISTEVLTPTILKFRLLNSTGSAQLSGMLLKLRRISIAVILILALIFERLVSVHSHLASIGLMSFVLLSQFAPAVVGALYWRRATTNGAFCSVLIGSCVWLYTLLIPLIWPDAAWINTGPFYISWLKPTALFGVTQIDNISHGVFFSLSLNLITYVLVSLLTRRSVGEKLQAELFVNKTHSQVERHLLTKDLYSLLQRFIDKPAADKMLTYAHQQGIDTRKKNEQLIDYTRLQLSGVLGSASTRMVMRAASSVQEMPLEDVASIVDEANLMFQFNRELLQSGVENIEQGISVIDADMRLVAWNHRYIELLDYPEALVVAGQPIEQLLRYNVERGMISGEQKEQSIAKRIEHMRSGSSHHMERIMPDGTVLEIRGQAMPGGGFVSTFMDITAHIEAEKALQQANETLEKRVASRTAELQHAKAEAEAANRSKTRFLAAASHDLMQPFNALSLFTSMLKKKVSADERAEGELVREELAQLANHIDDSLGVVEALLSDLVEISRLDGGSQQAELSDFAINELLMPLKNEFSLLAQQEDIAFGFVASGCFVNSDKRLLRRIVQNFLSNAVHYCNDKHSNQQSKILLGVRKRNKRLRIEVWDNGPGIAQDKQQAIFREFERLEQNREVPGLGLGLAISERIATILGSTITLQSIVGRGTCFSVDVPLVTHVKAAAERKPIRPAEKTNPSSRFELSVLLLDNDPLMLTALSSQLQEWGCEVITAKTPEDLNSQLDECDTLPDMIIADYHLDDGQNGVDAVSDLLAAKHWQIPCVICSADPSEPVRQHTSDADFHFLRKPVKSLALKRLIKQLL